MTERVYLLRKEDGTYYEKFFTSPYTAMAKGAVLNKSLSESGLTPTDFRCEMFVVDIEDVPCDHVVVKTFVSGFVNFIHGQTHEHGLSLSEESPCVFTLKLKGVPLAEVCIVYIPPNPEDIADVGSPVLQILKRMAVAEEKDIQEFSMLFGQYSSAW